MNILNPATGEPPNRSILRDSTVAGAFELSDVLRTIRTRRRLIVGTTLLILALAVIVVLLIRPLYSATAVVMLDQRKNSVADTGAVLSDLGSDPTTVENQVQILTSIELASRVVDKLRLSDDSEFDTGRRWTDYLAYGNPFNWFPGRATTRAAIERQDLHRSVLIHKFLDHLSVDPIGISTAIRITFTSEEPQKAQRIANAIADAYVEDQLEAKFQATQQATQWLSGRILELSRKAQQADTAVQRYKAEHNISTGSNGVSVVEQQTGDINSQLVIAKTQLAEKQAAYSGLVSLARSGRAADSAAAMASPVISALRAQDSEITRQLADLSSKYLPEHPKIVDLEAQKKNVESKISEEVQRIVDAARNDVAIAAAHVGSLQRSLGQVESEGASQNQARVGLTGLETAATSAKAMYEAFLGRLNQTQDQQGIQAPDARVISRAAPPQAPSFPRKGLTIALALPAGFVLGLLLAFAAERLDSGFRTSEQLEEMFRLPVLSAVPEVKGQGLPADLIMTKPMSAFSESIRGLHLGLRLANADHSKRIMVITSAVPGEGKTNLAIALGRAAAKAGAKTLVIDADIRRPALASLLGLPTSFHDLVDVLVGNAKVEKCLVKDPKSDLYILPCIKRKQATQVDILNSKSMKSVLASLSHQFDFIILDSAPMLPVNDTKVLGQLADSVVFVVQWERTARQAVRQALRALADVHAPLAGVVLTRADPQRFSYYSYGYQNYRSYKSYYQE